jgi:predicted permease
MILSLLASAFQAIVEIFLIISMGIICTHFNILNKSVQDGLSSLIVSLLTPCLLITTIVQIITIDTILQFWPLPIFAIVFIVISGIISNILFRLKSFVFSSYRENITIEILDIEVRDMQSNLLCALTIMCMFKNINTIPVPLVETMIQNNQGIFVSASSDLNETIAYAISMVLIYASIANMIAWIFGSLYISRNDRNNSRTIMKTILTPPNIAAVLGVIIGIIPITRDLFYPQTAIFYTSITKALEVVGAATVPCMLILFGALLYNNMTNKENTSLNIAIIDVMLLIVLSLGVIPLLLFAIITICWKFSIIPNDIILVLVLYIQASTPASVNLLLICDNVSNKQVQEFSLKLMSYQYIFSIITLTFWMTVCLYIISNGY